MNVVKELLALNQEIKKVADARRRLEEREKSLKVRLNEIGKKCPHPPQYMDVGWMYDVCELCWTTF